MAPSVWKACAVMGVGVPAFGALTWWAFSESSPLAGGLFALTTLAAFVLPARAALSALRAKPSAAPRVVSSGGPYREADVSATDRDLPGAAGSEGENAADEVDGEDADDDHNDLDGRPGSPVRSASIRDTVLHALEGLPFLRAVLVGVPLWWIGALLVVISTPRLQFSGAPFLDATVLALAPWGLGFVVLRYVERVRGERFGARHARVRWSATDAVLTVGAGSLGSILLASFIPRAASTHHPIDVALALAGPLLCALPVVAVRRCLKTA